MSANEHALLLDRGNLKRRNRVNRLVEVASTVAALLAVAVLVIVVGSVISKGIGAISLHFLTTPTGLFGDTSGGISNAIVGTAIIVGLAALMAIRSACWSRSTPPSSPRRGSPTPSASSSTSSTACRRSSPGSSSTA